MKRKISAFLAMICIIVSVFSGCDGVNKGKVIPLFVENKPNFIIIRPEKPDSETLKIANEFNQYFKDYFDVSVSYKPDSLKHKDGQLEINIGITNRPHAQDVYNEVANKTKTNGKDYIIKKNGDYIYIIGMSTSALQEAIYYFEDEFCYYIDDTIPENYNYIYRYKADASEAFSLNGNTDFSKYKIITPRYNMSYLVGREVAEVDDNILSINGTLVEQATDAEKESDYEIIIDKTNRKGTPDIESADQYRIKVDGNRIFVVGGSNEATAVAVKELNRMILDKKAFDKKTDIKGSYAETVKNYKKYYSLTFNDEFDKIDESVWTIQDGLVPNRTREGDPYIPYFTRSPKNQWVEDGKLYMKATLEQGKYNSVEWRTNDSTWFKYGLFETSVKINNSQGQVAATWLLGNHSRNYYAEIDIYESCKNWGKFTPIGWVSKAIDIPSGVLYPGYKGNLAVDPDKGDTYWHFDNNDKGDYFHTYGVEWTDSYITHFVDGREFITINTALDDRSRQTFNDFLQIIISHSGGMDTAGAGTPDETTDWENSYSAYDYVRLYQLPGQKLKKK